MIDPLSLVASVITIVDVAAKIIKKCKELQDTAHDAHRDLCQIYIQVSTLKVTLEGLEFCLSGEAIPKEQLEHLEFAVHGCKITVDDIAMVLNGLPAFAKVKTQLGKRQTLKNSLRWYLQQSKVGKLLDEASQHKSTITLALQVEVAKDVKNIKKNLRKLRHDIHGKYKRDIWLWLELTNPTQDHDKSHSLREEHTCQWLLNLPQWVAWKDPYVDTHRFMWIHGIPGAGKTILASYAVDQVDQFCSSLQVPNAYVYYYCSYRYTVDQCSSFLRWIVSQLSRLLEGIPNGIVQMHERNTEPSLSQLKRALKELLAEFQVVYIILDGVDECNTRDALLDVIRQLVTDSAYAKIRLLATSRLYVDIERVLGNLGGGPISMSNTIVDADIRIFVDSRIRANPKFAWWSLKLAAEVLEALVEGAKGMFQWVALQLEILQRKRSAADIRKALRTLPETIDETYERILMTIPNEDRHLARTAFLWICAHVDLPFQMDMPSNCVVETVFNKSTTTEEPHNFDLEALREICCCLVRTSSAHFNKNIRGHCRPLTIDECKDCVDDQQGRSFGTITLCHYTFREYLYSDRITKSRCREFAMSQLDANNWCLERALNMCAALDSKFPQTDNVDTFEEYCRMVVWQAPRSWYELLSTNQALWNLQKQVLCGSSFPPHYSPFFLLQGSDSITCHLPRNSLSTPQIRNAIAWLEVYLWDHEDLIQVFLETCDLFATLRTPIEIHYNHHYFEKDFSAASSTRTHFKGYVLEAMALDSNVWEFMKKLVSFAPQATSGINLLTLVSLHFGDRVHLQRPQHDCSAYPCTLRYLQGCEASPYNMGNVKKCFLKTALDSGAEPNMSNVPITPLQIAALNWDYGATKLLLERGANVNAVGNTDEQSEPWIDTTCATSSPLRILRKAEYGLQYLESYLRIRSQRANDKKEIEKLLLDAGAKDFGADELQKMTKISAGNRMKALKHLGGEDSGRA